MRSPVPSVRLAHGGGLECVPMEPNGPEARDRTSGQGVVVADNTERAKGKGFEVHSGNDNVGGFALDCSGITEYCQGVEAGCYCRELPPVLGRRRRYGVSQKSLDVVPVLSDGELNL
jgi:hypothetical protein